MRVLRSRNHLSPRTWRCVSHGCKTSSLISTHEVRRPPPPMHMQSHRLLEVTQVISPATPSPQSVSCSGLLNFGCYRRRFVTDASPTSGDNFPPYLIAIIAISMAIGIFASVIISIVRCSNRASSDTITASLLFFQSSESWFANLKGFL